MSKIGIVILHWHNSREVNSLLSSIDAWDKSRYVVYLVDNSQDFKQDFMGVQYILPTSNGGFAGGCNLGMKMAIDQGCDYILLLNADTAVKEADVGSLASRLTANGQLAAVSPVLLESRNGVKSFHKGGKNPMTYSNTRIEVDSLEAPAMQASYLPGTVLLLRAEAVNVIGYLDEDYFFSAEVADWFLRLNSTSWKFAVVDEVIVEHFNAGNEAYREKHYIYYSLRNRYLLINKFGGSETKKLIAKWNNQLRRQMLGALIRFDFGKFVTIYHAVKDGNKGNFGKSKLMVDH